MICFSTRARSGPRAPGPALVWRRRSPRSPSGKAGPEPTAPRADEDAFDAALAARGSRAAFERLHRKHESEVIRLATRCLGDREDGLDVAQEVFLKAYLGLPEFRGGSTFRTWLLRITVNTARSLLSRSAAKKRGGGAREARLDAPRFVSDGQAGAQEVADPEDRGSPARLLERKELKEALETAIARLDAPAREIITRRDLLDQSYEAVSRALDLPLGTVKSRVHRARLDLRAALAGAV